MDGEDMAVSRGTSLRLGAVDVDVSLAEHAGRIERGHGILMQRIVELRTHFHGDFDRGQRVASDDTYSLDIADVDGFKAHRSAKAEAAGVVEIRFQSDFRSEHAGGAAHQENENGQRYRGKQNRQAYSQFGPMQLLLARQRPSQWADLQQEPAWQGKSYQRAAASSGSGLSAGTGIGKVKANPDVCALWQLGPLLGSLPVPETPYVDRSGCGRPRRGQSRE